MFDLNSDSPREKILIDLHYYAIKFAIENSFSKIQISSFASIIRSIHRANQGNLKNKISLNKIIFVKILFYA